MCLSPILIKNQSRMYRGKVDTLTAFHDTTSQYIYVPCGVCPDCCRKKQMYIVQRTQLEQFDNYIFFATFTYSNDMIRSIDVNGFTHYYADVKDIQNMLKRCRKRPDWIVSKYLYVVEYGGKRHRPHFHALFFVPKKSTDHIYTPLNYQSILYDMFKDEWKRNVGSTRYPIYHPLCKFISVGNKRTYDLHYVNPQTTNNGCSDVGFYVTKYCLKFDDWIDKKRKALYLNLEPDEYYKVWKLLRPRVQYSHFFGLSSTSRDYIRKCIDEYSNNSLYPLFCNPITGQLFPMSPYLFNRYGTLKDKYNFYYRAKHPDSLNDSFHYTNIDYDSYQTKIDSYNRTCSQIIDNDVYDFL